MFPFEAPKWPKASITQVFLGSIQVKVSLKDDNSLTPHLYECLPVPMMLPLSLSLTQQCHSPLVVNVLWPTFFENCRYHQHLPCICHFQDIVPIFPRPQMQPSFVHRNYPLNTYLAAFHHSGHPLASICHQLLLFTAVISCLAHHARSILRPIRFCMITLSFMVPFLPNSSSLQVLTLSSRGDVRDIKAQS